jgi:hypothetical protein
VLDDVLVEQLLKINRFRFRGKEYPFNLEDAHEALRRLKPTPDKLKGLRGTNQDIYDQLILGTTITKAIEGDSKSYSFRYVGRLPSPRMRATATLRLSYKIDSGTPPKKANAEMCPSRKASVVSAG